MAHKATNIPGINGKREEFAIELMDNSSDFKIAIWVDGKKVLPFQRDESDPEYMDFDVSQFICCMSEAWGRLFLEQDMPNDGSNKEAEEFKKVHCINLWLNSEPEIMLIREGNNFQIFVEEELIYSISYNKIRSILSNLGYKLVRAPHLLSKCSAKWTAREDLDSKTIVSISTGINSSESELQDYLIKEIKNIKFDKIIEDHPVLALARMARQGDLNSKDIKEIIEISKSVTKHPIKNNKSSLYNELIESIPEDVYDRYAYPYEQAYALADFVRSKASLFIEDSNRYDIEKLADEFGIHVESKKLPTKVEALALWDANKVCIIVNTEILSSKMPIYKRRFVIAHEICHFLIDKNYARPLGNLSLDSIGELPIEQRANAFAAELLLPRDVAIDYIQNLEKDNIESINDLSKNYIVSQTVAANQIGNGARKNGIELGPNIKKYIMEKRAGKNSYIGENQAVRHIVDRIANFKEMQPGWYEGDGKVVSKSGANWLRQHVTKFLSWEIGEPAVFPTLDGNIELEWKEGQFEGFLEINLKEKKAEWYSFSWDEPDDITEITIPISFPYGWKQLVELLEKFMNGVHYE